MADHQTKGAKDNWASLAPVYDEIESASIPALETLFKLANNYWPLSTATGILDNGMGPATVTNYLLSKHGAQVPAAATLLGLDKAPSMVDEAKARRAAEIARGNTAWERVQLREGDAETLAGVSDGSVSHVFGGMFYFMLADPQAALVETRRVLTAENGGGVVAISAMARNDWVDMGLLMGDVRPQNKMTWNHAWKSVEAVEGLLKDAGFRDVHAEDVEILWRYETHEGLLSFLMDHFPLYTVFRRDCTDDEWERLRKITLDFMKKRSPEAPGALKGECVCVVGRK